MYEPTSLQHGRQTNFTLISFADIDLTTPESSETLNIPRLEDFIGYSNKDEGDRYSS